MAVNKVVIGGKVAVDLTRDTITADKLLKGTTAHDSAGNAIIGTMGGDSFLPKPYALTDYWVFSQYADSGSWKSVMSNSAFSGAGISILDSHVSVSEQLSCNFGRLHAFSIYVVFRADADSASVRELISTSHGEAPQFNLCSFNGNLDIVTAEGGWCLLYLQVPANEWHTVAMTFEGACGYGKGALYIDGVIRNYYYNFYAPYPSPVDGNIYISGQYKTFAVCRGCAHGEDVVAENSEFLRKKYLN